MGYHINQEKLEEYESLCTPKVVGGGGGGGGDISQKWGQPRILLPMNSMKCLDIVLISFYPPPPKVRALRKMREHFI